MTFGVQRRTRRPQPRLQRPVEVTHILGAVDRGGAETVSLDLCRAIDPATVRQTFVTLNGWEGSLAAQFRASGALVRQCPLRPRYSFPSRLWWLLRSTRPDVLVSHVCLTSGAMLVIARLAGVPVRIARLQSAGDGQPDTLPRRGWRALMRRTLRGTATQVLGVTAAALEFTDPPPADPRYRVLVNGVPADRVAGWTRAEARRRWDLPDGARVMVHIGRSAAVKNRPFAVAVHRAVRDLDPGARLLFAGPGGVDDLTGAYPELAGDPTVRLAGEVDEIASVLAAADVLLLPSLWEGLPGVILEALTAGVPVVASDVPSLREVATQVDGMTVVPLADGPQRWAGVVAALPPADATARARIAEQFRASPFHFDRSVEQWMALWRATSR